VSYGPETFARGGERAVRRLGFGAMRLTGPGIWRDPPDRGAAIELLREAVRLGVQHIDTADAYGPETSETLIADALHPYPEGLLIATKGGFTRQGPGRWRADGRPEHLRAACEASLRRLRVDAIDVYYFHTPDPAVPYEESVGALAELRREGLIRDVGISNVDEDELRSAQAIVPVAMVQNRHNLADRSDAVLAACEAQSIAFVPWYPLANGQLTSSGARELRSIAAAHGATPAQVAIAWLLHTSPVTMPIPGTSSAAHLRENLAAGDLDLSGAEVAALEAMKPPRRPLQPVRDLAYRVRQRLPSRR
jgi:aryl-alcohol dehydrogenase-like predicted oxidoreductase